MTDGLRNDPAAAASLVRLRTVALAVGVAASAVSAVGIFVDREQFFRSYLVAYLFWIGVPLGCLAILLIHHVSGGRWGFVIRRFLEAATRTIWPMAILFLPLVAGMRDIFIWSRPEVVAGDALLQEKAPYLNVSFFLVRAAIYFAVWIGLSFVIGRLTRRLDESDDERVARGFRVVGGLGIALYGLTVSFAGIDWAMSVDPHWFSTIFGPVVGVGQILSGLAVCILFTAWLRGQRPLKTTLAAGQTNDLGNLTLTFVMLWAYLAFSQLLIIWSGNVREEVPWYLTRMTGGWNVLAVGLIVFHFAVPFLFLLSRSIKRNLPVLARLSAWLLFMRLVDIFWIVAPKFHEAGLAVHWLDVTLVLAIGGLWLAFMVHQVAARSLVAPHDTRVLAVTRPKELPGHA